MKPLCPIFLGEDLFACQPVVEATLSAGGDVLLTAKPASHKTLYDFMAGAEMAERAITQKTAGKHLRLAGEAPVRPCQKPCQKLSAHASSLHSSR